MEVLYNHQKINFTEIYKYLGNQIDHYLNLSKSFGKSYEKASDRLDVTLRQNQHDWFSF